jgi:hypothetical protein
VATAVKDLMSYVIGGGQAAINSNYYNGYPVGFQNRANIAVGPTFPVNCAGSSQGIGY